MKNTRVEVWLVCFIAISEIFLPQAYEIKGRALLAVGQLEQAHAALSIGRDQAIRFRKRRVLWEIYADLSELEAQRANSAQAGEWKLPARQTLKEFCYCWVAIAAAMALGNRFSKSRMWTDTGCTAIRTM